jgi:hypothetical protein
MAILSNTALAISNLGNSHSSRIFSAASINNKIRQSTKDGNADAGRQSISEDDDRGRESISDISTLLMMEDYVSDVTSRSSLGGIPVGGGTEDAMGQGMDRIPSPSGVALPESPTTRKRRVSKLRYIDNNTDLPEYPLTPIDLLGREGQTLGRMIAGSIESGLTDFDNFSVVTSWLTR